MAGVLCVIFTMHFGKSNDGVFFNSFFQYSGWWDFLGVAPDIVLTKWFLFVNNGQWKGHELLRFVILFLYILKSQIHWSVKQNNSHSLSITELIQSNLVSLRSSSNMFKILNICKWKYFFANGLACFSSHGLANICVSKYGATSF